MGVKYIQKIDVLRPTIIAAALAKFTVGTFALSLSPLLPEIEKSLNIPQQWLGFAGGSYGLSSAIMALISSSIQDKFNREKLIITGILIHFIGILLTASATLFSVLLIGKLICGVGAGLLLPAIVAFLADRTPYEKRAAYLGKTNIGWAACTLAGVPILSAVGGYFGWRTAQFCLAILWPLIIALLFFNKKSPKLASLETSSPTGISSNGNISDIQPMFFITFLFFIGFYGVYSFIGVFMKNANHLDPINIGMIILCYGLGFLMATMYSNIIDRIGKEKMLFYSLITLSLLLFFVSTLVILNIFIAALFMFLWGNAQNLAFTSSTGIVSGVPESIRGKSLAINQAALSLGAAVGTTAMGFILSYFSFWVVGVCCSALTMIAVIITKYKLVNPID